MARNHVLTARIWHTPQVRWVRQSFSVDRLYRNLSAHRRRLPDYLIGGAQKSGTTSLWEYLNDHPNVEAAGTKETNYFDAHYQRGAAWYRSNFPLMQDDFIAEREKKLTGESCANYLFHPLAAERAAETVPQVKIIFLLRNPVDRAFSHYQLKLRRRQETLSFADAIASESDRLRAEEEKILATPYFQTSAHNWHSYLARGRYWEQLIRWQRHFPSDQLLILESGEFFKRTPQVYTRVLEFLNLPLRNVPDFTNRFPGQYSEKMSEATRRRLIDYFAPHNERLYAHLGTRFNWDK